jgi:hypothetical protein
MANAKSFLCVAFGTVLTSIAAFHAAADTIPFWGDDVPATNRVCASSLTASIVGGFESRIGSSAEFSLQKFSSNRFGTVLTVR